MLDEHIAHNGLGLMPYINIFSLRVSSYTIFMILAFAAAFICYKLTAAKVDKQNRSYRSLIIIYALLGSIIGAKLPIIIFNFNLLFKYPENINLIVSGKTIIGGLVGGFIAVHILKKRLNLNVKTGNDIAAPAALGMAIGRLGCLFGGCCYGMESPEIFGIKFGDGTYRYPTQIYEIIFDLGLFVFFMYLKNNKTLKPGILFRYLLNSYLIFRFLVEFLRESDRLALGISYYQIICLLCVIFINRTYIINAIKGKHIKVRLEN